MIQNRTKQYVDKAFEEEQAEFRSGRNKIDQILTVRQIL